MNTTAPPRPVAGMQVWVQWGARWCHGVGYRIARVTGRTFTVAGRGGMLRRPPVEWPAWLAERFAKGRVCLDGVWLTAPDPWGVRDDMDIDVTARERRLAKAVREVAKSYRITEAPGGRFSVTGGQRDYEVVVHRDWSAPATCTCPDAVRGGADAAGGCCKHVIAVLLQDPDLRCQLLDVLL